MAAGENIKLEQGALHPSTSCLAAPPDYCPNGFLAWLSLKNVRSRENLISSLAPPLLQILFLNVATTVSAPVLQEVMTADSREGG